VPHFNSPRLISSHQDARKAKAQTEATLAEAKKDTAAKARKVELEKIEQARVTHEAARLSRAADKQKEEDARKATAASQVAAREAKIAAVEAERKQKAEVAAANQDAFQRKREKKAEEERNQKDAAAAAAASAKVNAQPGWMERQTSHACAHARPHGPTRALLRPRGPTRAHTRTHACAPSAPRRRP